jgi:hypothetical protein
MWVQIGERNTLEETTWEYNIRIYLREIGCKCEEWIDMAKIVSHDRF